jgi:glycine betaine/proline transport system ATP-binding protein
MRDGRFVQVGTPAEVVGAPADDYVANFVRDVPRSHVVSVGAVMRPIGLDGVDAGARGWAGTVAADTKVRDVVGYVADSELPVRIVDGDGAAVGSIDRVAVLAVIAGEHLALTGKG